MPANHARAKAVVFQFSFCTFHFALCLSFALASEGCFFKERSFPHDPATRVTIDPPDSQATQFVTVGASQPDADRPAITTRQWLVAADRKLRPLLPAHRKAPLLTEQLTQPTGQPTDLVAQFEIKTDHLESIFANFLGLAYSAQASSAHESARQAPPWDGFEDVWIPVRPDLQLSGRLGLARDSSGRVNDADCIVILPGLRGDHSILRVRDLAVALRRSGFHVLSIELRGMGQTDRRYPACEYTWGILETNDLLLVADWLQSRPHVRRTGLVGYSWGSNQAIMAAWAEGRTDTDGIPPRLVRYMTPTSQPGQPARRFQAGAIAFSPIPRFENLLDKLEVEQSAWQHPALSGLQATVRDRMIFKGYPNPCGSMRELFKHIGIGYDEAVADGLEYVRLMPYKGLAVHDRLNGTRVPLLIVHSADDMIAPAQDVADLIATTHNPNVAAIVLPSGGHIGFAPYATAWYYNLILNFFDPVWGAAGEEWTRGRGDAGTRGN